MSAGHDSPNAPCKSGRRRNIALVLTALTAGLLPLACISNEVATAYQSSTTVTQPAESPAALQGEEVAVTHPYHSESADAPNYLVPQAVAVAPNIRLADAPPSVPAQRLVLEHPPETDLTLRPSPADPTELSWRCGEEDPVAVRLSGQDVAAKRAREFLEEHGLWLQEWTEPIVTVGSSTSSGSDYQVTSWLVRFVGDPVLPGITRSASVRVGHEDQITQVSLRLPRVEALPGVVRLLSLEYILQDLQAWKDGLPDYELQEQISGPVDVNVLGYELLYERPLAPKGDYIAVPVYEFRVEVRAETTAPIQGAWRVVAAAETDLPATRGR